MAIAIINNVNNNVTNIFFIFAFILTAKVI